MNNQSNAPARLAPHENACPVISLCAERPALAAPIARQLACALTAAILLLALASNPVERFRDEAIAWSAP